MAKVGDKYIVEIDDRVLMNGGYYAVLKGFPKILLSENDLDILEKYEPPEEEKSSPVNVGDEIEDENGARWFVTAIQKRNDSVFDVFGVGFDGHTHNTNTAKAKRTGYRNRHIVDALAWTVPVEML